MADTTPTQLVRSVARLHRRPHQEEAVAATLQELSIASRATAVLPCGSGKTLIELWVIEGTKAHTVVVFEPTRALVRQTLLVFREQALNRTTRLLAVSSDSQGDSDTDIDDEVLDGNDDHFEATTDVEAVRRFLTEPGDHPRILIATYHSAHVVRAARTAAVTIDLAVFDEAHKTAGRAGKAFAAALDDNWLPITSRFFLTATPRHTEITGPDADRSETVVYSMDNPDLYGRVVYTLTYREAVDSGIILPFRVVIAVVTHNEVAAAIGRDLRVDHPDNPQVSARQIAQWVALGKTMQEFKLKKAFTFHETVQAAKSFLDMDALVPGVASNDINCLHINGTHNHKERATLFEAFHTARSAVLSNARCLTEGVDVPSVDIVAFNSNRRSVIDIVQGTGRCQRRAEGKESGYVLLPVFIDQREDETSEEAAERADLGEVGAVLRALAEQDGQIIDNIRIAGRPGASNENQDKRISKAAEVVSLRVYGDGIDISKISAAITTRVLLRICSTWDDYYERLRRDNETHGKGWVPRRKSANDYEAYPDWVSKQRRLKRIGKLSADRIAKLDNISFPWESTREPESSKYAEQLHGILKALPTKENKPFNLDRREHELGGKTMGPIKRVRGYKQRGSLTEYWRNTLDDVGMVWEALGTRDKRFTMALNEMTFVWGRQGETEVVTLADFEVTNPVGAAIYRDVVQNPFSPAGRSIATMVARTRARLEPDSWEQAMAIIGAQITDVYTSTMDTELAKEILIGIIRRQQRARVAAVHHEHSAIVQMSDKPPQAVVEGVYERLRDLCYALYDPEIPRRVIDAAVPILTAGGFVRRAYDKSYWCKANAVRVGPPEEFVFTKEASEEITQIRKTCRRLTGKTISIGRTGTLRNRDKERGRECSHLPMSPEESQRALDDLLNGNRKTILMKARPLPPGIKLMRPKCTISE